MTIYQKLYADLADRYAECLMHFISEETFKEYYWELFGEMPEVVPRTIQCGLNLYVVRVVI